MFLSSATLAQFGDDQELKTEEADREIRGDAEVEAEMTSAFTLSDAVAQLEARFMTRSSCDIAGEAFSFIHCCRRIF